MFSVSPCSPRLFSYHCELLEKLKIEFPDGGGESLVDSLVTSVKAKGGDVLTSSGVEKILFENGQSTGVETKDGNKLYADKIISSIGIKKTLFELVPEQERPTSLVKTLEKHHAVPSLLELLIVFNGDISNFGIGRTAYKTVIGDLSTMSRNPTEKGWICDDLTISFTSFLDKAHQDPEYQTAEMHHETRYEYFDKYEGKQDSKEYKKICTRITRNYLDRLEESFPGLTKRVSYTRLFTPLDVKNFTHHDQGSMFGLDIQKAFNPELSPRSGMKNLFFTGEDIFAQGLTPLNGVITASVVTGKNLIRRFKKAYKANYSA